jgi:hypothetical protein
LLLLLGLFLGKRLGERTVAMNEFRSTRNGNTISLSADSPERWIQTKSKVLFVPSCYDEIWTICQDEVIDGTSSLTGIVISGTPGVGKSCFLDFALHKLLIEQGKPVLYLHGKDGHAYVYTIGDDGIVERQRHTIAHVRENDIAAEVDFVLIDPPEGGDPNFFSEGNLMSKKFILAVSPDRNNCQSLRKGRGQLKLYMGTRTIEELEKMRATCYPTVPARVVVDRFQEFGGIPRFIFEAFVDRAGGHDLALEHIRSYQQNALRDIVESPQRIDSGEVVGAYKSLWTLYHIQSVAGEDGSTNYFKFTIAPCCDDARTRIRDELMQKSVSDLWSTYSGTREDLGALRGIRFEAYAHKKILVEGLTQNATGLTRRGLSKKASKSVNVPASSTKIDLPNNDVGVALQAAVTAARAATSSSYLLPHLSNFPVVDSIFIPIGHGEAIQLQMKAGKSRPLSAEKADAIKTATGSNDLVFVVPDCLTMTKQLPGASLKQYRIVLNETD